VTKLGVGGVLVTERDRGLIVRKEKEEGGSFTRRKEEGRTFDGRHTVEGAEKRHERVLYEEVGHGSAWSRRSRVG